MRSRQPICAFARDGGYSLTGSTYDHREAIKAVGGAWNPAKKLWWIPEACFDVLIAHGVAVEKMVRVRRAPYCCSNPEEEIWVTERDAQRGATMESLCLRCDSRYEKDVAILGIVDGAATLKERGGER